MPRSVASKLIKAAVLAKSRQNFLTHRTDHYGLLPPDQLPPFIDRTAASRMRSPRTAVGKRPNRRVDEHAHPSAPPRLRRRSRFVVVIRVPVELATSFQRLELPPPSLDVIAQTLRYGGLLGLFAAQLLDLS